MKAKRTKLLMAAIMGAACCVGAQAHIAIVKQTPTLPGHPTVAKYNPSIDLSRYELKSEQGGIKTYASKPQFHQKCFNAAPGQTVTVTCNIVGDERTFGRNYGDNITLVKDGMNLDYYGQGNHQVVCLNVPIGTYDVYTFQLSVQGSYHGVIKEQVNIISDTTIVLDLDESTNQVESNFLKHDGTMCTVDLIKKTGEVLEEGNSFAIYKMFCILSKEANEAMGWYILNQQFTYDGFNNKLFLNDVSNRIKIIFTGSARDSTAQYIVTQSKDGIDGDFSFVNDPADYVLYQEQFQPTPSYNPEEGAISTSLDVKVIYNGIDHKGFTSASTRLAPNGLTSFYIDAAEHEDNNLKWLFWPGFCDKLDSNGPLFMKGQAALVSKNGVEYVNSGHDIAGYYSFHVPEDPNADIIYYPGNPYFSFTDQQKALPYGTGCPINAVMAQNSYQEWLGGKYSFLDFVYLGRYGEFRGSDLASATLKITYNQDSVICTDVAAMMMDMYNFAMEYKEGQIDVDVVNTNVEVDGLPGKNHTHVFYDWTQKDWTAPTLQMLWLRDDEGNIIDRFASGDEGVLEFAGGDFNFHQTDRSWFDCQPQTVEVSYSPYEADSWEPFAVEEVPENFFMPAFGYFYRGDLSQVEGNGEKGWFDLKIKLTDLSGNWQEQVISPAFRIDDHAYSSVANVGKDNAHEVARYTLDGRRISTQQPGINIVRYSDGTARKVLVAQ